MFFLDNKFMYFSFNKIFLNRCILATPISNLLTISCSKRYEKPSNSRANFRAGADPEQSCAGDPKQSAITRQELASSLKHIGKTWEKVLTSMCPKKTPPKRGKDWDEKIEASVTLTRKVPVGGKGDLAGLDELIDPLLAGGRAVQFMMRNTSNFPGNNPLRGIQTKVTEVGCSDKPKKSKHQGPPSVLGK